MYTFDEIKSKLSVVNPKISFYKEGDFGDLSRIEVEKDNIGVSIEFWSTGWLHVYVLDYSTAKEIINRLLEPTEQDEQRKQIENVFHLLQLSI